MSDIVERLRKASISGWPDTKQCAEAAELIERLQGELDRVRDRLRAENDEVEKLVERLQTSENENDRYRKALELIRDAPPNGLILSEDGNSGIGVSYLAWEALKEGDALQETENEWL